MLSNLENYMRFSEDGCWIMVCADANHAREDARGSQGGFIVWIAQDKCSDSEKRARAAPLENGNDASQQFRFEEP